MQKSVQEILSVIVVAIEGNLNVSVAYANDTTAFENLVDIARASVFHESQREQMAFLGMQATSWHLTTCCQGVRQNNFKALLVAMNHGIPYDSHSNSCPSGLLISPWFKSLQLVGGCYPADQRYCFVLELFTYVQML